jgi:CheY-like chemotaxis protein
MNKKILIIEDEEELINLYSEFLRAKKFDVHCAHTIENAKKLAKKFQADLLLIDHSLRGNGKNGLNALPELRKSFPNAILILFSNFTKKELKRLAEIEDENNAGEKISKNFEFANDYWYKSDCNLDNLLKKIKTKFRKKLF